MHTMGARHVVDAAAAAAAAAVAAAADDDDDVLTPFYVCAPNGASHQPLPALWQTSAREAYERSDYYVQSLAWRVYVCAVDIVHR